MQWMALQLYKLFAIKVPIGFNILVGVAAPLLWTSQNTYISRCALQAAANSHEDTDMVTTRTLIAMVILVLMLNVLPCG